MTFDRKVIIRFTHEQGIIKYAYKQILCRVYHEEVIRLSYFTEGYT